MCEHKNIYDENGKITVTNCQDCKIPVWKIVVPNEDWRLIYSPLCVKPGGCREGKGPGICQGMDGDKPWCV